MVYFLFGAPGGTRTRTVSHTPLKRARLPISPLVQSLNKGASGATDRSWTYDLALRRRLLYPLSYGRIGRNDAIWTRDPYHPKVVHYQAVLRPDAKSIIH